MGSNVKVLGGLLLLLLAADIVSGIRGVEAFIWLGIRGCASSQGPKQCAEQMRGESCD